MGSLCKDRSAIECLAPMGFLDRILYRTFMLLPLGSQVCVFENCQAVTVLESKTRDGGATSSMANIDWSFVQGRTKVCQTSSTKRILCSPLHCTPLDTALLYYVPDNSYIERHIKNLQK